MDTFKKGIEQEGVNDELWQTFRQLRILLPLAGIVFLVFMYALVSGLQSYDGIVTHKEKFQAGRKRPHMVYKLQIDNSRYRVNQCLYDSTEIGDHVRQAFLMPWALVNGRQIPLEDNLFSIGAWSGMVFCIIISFFLIAPLAISRSKDKTKPSEVKD